MTISYSDQFFKLLLRWKGSLWKTIWKDLALYLLLYYSINMAYRFGMGEDSKALFLKYIVLFNGWTHEIPLTFLLGFYVAMIIRRWWEQCQWISWPDQLLFNVSALIRGSEPETRIIRRTIARYCILSSVLAWRSVSLRVLMRYPTDEHLLTSGLMNQAEYDVFRQIEVKVDPHKKWFVPLNWIQTMLVRCLEQERLSHTNELRSLLDNLSHYRQGFFQLFLYDWITIPLVYTQVATISVYGFFAFTLIGRQFPSVNDAKETVDLYVPVFTILQFLFYIGWLKVGEDLMFPFGADDEDFEFNYILDRDFEMAYLIVDDLHNQVPPVYVDSLNAPVELMHTKGSKALFMHAQKQHLRKHEVAKHEMAMADENDVAGSDVGPFCCVRKSKKQSTSRSHSFEQLPTHHNQRSSNGPSFARTSLQKKPIL